MKVTVGTDIIEVERIKNAIESNKQFSARFAAKEAVFKAISVYLKDKYSISWKNVEVLNDKDGRPYINLLDIDINIKDVDISLSHIKDYAIANVVVTMEE